MEFRHATAEKGIKVLTESLIAALEKHSRTLWLVPGGSNIPLSVRVMRAIPEALTYKLHIMLTDERYGEPGHEDSNASQLYAAGFEPQHAVFIETLRPGLSLDETVRRYGETFMRENAAAGYSIGQFGIGADGHIAGILPHSPAAHSNAPAAGYESAPYTRVTLTFPALRNLDMAYVFAYGEEKRGALGRLAKTSDDLAAQPCQILRQIPESYVYN
jgi:6-phosphogluconolactonase/glucosamine-6-phosphate isomerase/deaminase